MNRERVFEKPALDRTVIARTATQAAEAVHAGVEIDIFEEGSRGHKTHGRIDEQKQDGRQSCTVIRGQLAVKSRRQVHHDQHRERENRKRKGKLQPQCSRDTHRHLDGKMIRP